MVSTEIRGNQIANKNQIPINCKCTGQGIIGTVSSKSLTLLGNRRNFAGETDVDQIFGVKHHTERTHNFT